MKNFIENRTLFLSTLLLILIGFGSAFLISRTPIETQSSINKIPAKKSEVIKEETLAEVTIWMMNTPKCSGSKSNGLSEVKKTMLARQIDRILTSIGGDKRTQEAFIFLMCQESQYRSGLTSPAGAKGVSQLMPATAQAEADELNMGKLTSDDLMDNEINILIGYTHFKKLAASYNGNLAKASAAYNGGPAGSTIKAMKSGGLGAQETDAYVRSMFDMQEERRIAKLEKQKIDILK